jgi:hypothetical protein
MKGQPTGQTAPSKAAARSPGAGASAGIGRPSGGGKPTVVKGALTKLQESGVSHAKNFGTLASVA